MTDAPAARRAELWKLLGDLPDLKRGISVSKPVSEDRGTYILEKFTLDLNGIESVPALFVKPKGKGPFPAVLYNHFHGGKYELGKKELLQGDPNLLQQPAYAEELTGRGYAALCIDHWCFGERRGRTESAIFKEMLWRGQVLWGMMVYDSVRALDYLSARPDVSASRIGTVGLSMGSTMAWWLAALDPRVKVCVDLCCLTDFEELIACAGLDGHGIYYYVPGLLRHFTTAQINALISPRAHLSLAGRYDRLTPEAGLKKIDHELQNVYRHDDAADKWKQVVYDCGHMETAAMRAEVIQFFEKWL